MHIPILLCIWRMALITAAGSAVAGCAAFPTVQPWEKGALSRPEMTFKNNTLSARYSEHIYNSREAASGGSGVGGGGCGCN